MTVASISVRVMSLRVRRPGLPERLADAGTALSQLDRLQAANRRVDPQPTAAQKDSGNYRKGHFTWKGLDIAIETAKGQKRKPEWPPLKNSYGYFKKTESGADEDPIDVFISEKNLDSEVVFVINQLKKDGKTFDEHKVIIGDSSEADARKTYLANYEPGWQGLGSVKAMALEDFKKWLKDGDTAKAAADRGGVPVVFIKDAAYTWVPRSALSQIMDEGLFSGQALLGRPDLLEALGKGRGGSPDFPEKFRKETEQELAGHHP